MNIKAQAIIILLGCATSVVESRIKGAESPSARGITSRHQRSLKKEGGTTGGSGNGNGNNSGGGSGVATSGGCGTSCADGEFCEEDLGVCGDGSTGSCTVMPELCMTLYDPVCGCDGKEYSNGCSAHSAGVNIASDGPCKPNDV